ncbi:hypothetical protein CQW44_03680 [Streptomyces griseofuscus]|uniref:Uncharacterized protein n=1 Tax=Streptomyces griseofuscus TaxID=146922 RepID=A0A3R8QN43_9ACTN|nr:hypothetical protein CQW44_03680 [Streptomyces griseofuscus]
MLPWETETGNPCFLSTDGGSSTLAKLADEMEAVQLSMGVDVLKEASKVLANPLSPNAEVRYAGVRLAECLRDALRVAESRGMRLHAPDVTEDGNATEDA